MTSDWSPVRFHASGCEPLIPATRPTFSPLCCLLAQSILHGIVYENVIGDGVESLAKLKLNNIYCIPVDATECCARDIFKILSRVWLELLEKSNEF